jgi:2-oxo-4-hydroxy-4-carboxy-5-ureidoimidazoline decarboxylase
MTLEKLNALSARDAVTLFRQACGSVRWAEEMAGRRPYADREGLAGTAESVWRALPAEEWKAAFAHHPKIGDIKDLRRRFPTTARLAEGEQAGMALTTEKVLKAFAEGNNLYEAKFGYIFIVCATGKTAEEMLSLLNARLSNVPAEEILLAAAEQSKITKLRLAALIV